MERLTRTPMVEGGPDMTPCDLCYMTDCKQNTDEVKARDCWEMAMYNKLRDYEDTNLTPGEIAELQKAKTEGRLVEKKTCQYKLFNPSEHGYDNDALFYECSCGASYINIEATEDNDWQYCPHCGGEILGREVLQCINCESAKHDGDNYHCENSKGKHSYECVDDACFDGCKCFKRKAAEAALKGE